MTTVDLDDLLDRAHVVALPMRVRFRGITVREALLIDGPRGWGEFSAFTEYGPREAGRWLAAGIEAAYRGLPAPQAAAVPVNATIPAIPAEDVADLLDRYPGIATVKVKVAEAGQDLAQDVARVAAVRAARPEARIRVDANRGWSVPEALRAAAELAALGNLEYLEQPCPTAEDLAELTARIRAAGIPAQVAADESIRKASDPYRVAELQAAEVAVLKVAPLGGVRNVATIAGHLAQRGMSVTVASALDTAVGMHGGAIAASISSEYAAGLATGTLFERDVADLAVQDGMLSTEPVVPDASRLSELAAPARRRGWWLDRVRACWPTI